MGAAKNSWLLGRVLCGVLVCIAPFALVAQTPTGILPWDDYERLVEKGRNIAPLDGGGMFGDSVDLYSGALSFAATDVSIPGNNALPVAVGRKLSIHNRYEYGGHGKPFGDWEIDVPNISGIYATTWHDDRCTQPIPPSVSQFRISAYDYWAGNQVSMPGGGELLRAESTRPRPTTGGPYLWLTAGDVYFSCLSAIKNGTGQGFLAVAKDGTKYWFDHMASDFSEPGLLMADAQGRISTNRAKVALYVTRVEDRFGNWVNYAYGNAYNQSVQLTEITASDGRTIKLQYANGLVSSISDGVRSWSYQYNGGHLASVTLPDLSKWSFNLAPLANFEIMPASGDPRTCESFEG